MTERGDLVTPGRTLAPHPGPRKRVAGRLSCARVGSSPCSAPARQRRQGPCSRCFTFMGQPDASMFRYARERMNRFGFDRARRFSALMAVLALYLSGSNTCVLGAWSGDTRMACLTMPKAGAPVPACHHAAPGSKPSGRPAGKPSCCPAPVDVPTAPSLEGDTALATLSAPALASAADAHAPLHPRVWRGHRALPDGQPPTLLDGAPSPARAPPLA